MLKERSLLRESEAIACGILAHCGNDFCQHVVVTLLATSALQGWILDGLFRVTVSPFCLPLQPLNNQWLLWILLKPVERSWLEKYLKKLCYPVIESHEWRIVTGCYPKSTNWRILASALVVAYSSSHQNWTTKNPKTRYICHYI